MILGIGSDLCDIRRIERSLERFGERFAQEIDLHQVGYLFLLDSEASLTGLTVRPLEPGATLNLGPDLLADVLPGNTAMLKAFERGGFRRKAAVQPDVVQVGLELG